MPPLLDSVLEKFNKNQYINYFRFEKYFEIQKKSIKDYFDEQETFWGDVLNSFVEKKSDKKSENVDVETLNQSLKSLASSIHGKDKVDDEEIPFKSRLLMWFS